MKDYLKYGLFAGAGYLLYKHFEPMLTGLLPTAEPQPAPKPNDGAPGGTTPPPATPPPATPPPTTPPATIITPPVVAAMLLASHAANVTDPAFTVYQWNYFYSQVTGKQTWWGPSEYQISDAAKISLKDWYNFAVTQAYIAGASTMAGLSACRCERRRGLWIVPRVA